MARPTKLTKKLQDKICNAIRAGNYIETASAYAGISKSTLYDWLKRGEREKVRVSKNSRARIRKKERIYVEFSDAVEKALADSEVRDVAIIANAAKENWQAAAWRLERKFPNKWGRRFKADVEHSGQVKHDVTSKIINDPEAVELAEELFRRTIANDVEGDSEK